MTLDPSSLLATVNGMAKAAKKATTTRKKNRPISPLAKAFAVRLVELREAKGMTKIDLARLAGVSRKFLWEIEEQRKEPGISTIERLAMALDITPADMFTP